MIIRVGTCGFPRSRGKIFRALDIAEIQETFYNPPPPEKARILRREAPQGFLFSVKAWQVITHSSESPTMKRLGRKLEGDPSEYGLLKPTKRNLWAWEVVEEYARELGARFIVLQTPPSFGYSDEALKWVGDFLSTITRRGFEIGWEPRGSWNSEDNRGRLCDLLNKHKVIHVVDILRREPCPQDRDTPLYTRLHGLGGGEVNYRYKYLDKDLEDLYNKIYSRGCEEALALFNNIHMWDDAKRFKSLVAERLGASP